MRLRLPKWAWSRLYKHMDLALRGELERLRAENARLRELLDAVETDWRDGIDDGPEDGGRWT